MGCGEVAARPLDSNNAAKVSVWKAWEYQAQARDVMGDEV